MSIKISDIKIIDKTKKDYNNRIEFVLSGDDINYNIINTLRRGIEEYIPSYAFDLKNMIIKHNTSIFNNDYMRLRLSLVPVLGVKNDISNIEKVLNLEAETNKTIFDKKLENVEVLKQMEDKQLKERANNLTLIVNKTINNSNKIMNITTDNAIFRYNTKIIPSPYNPPLLLIKLKPGQEFSCECYSSLDIPLRNAIYLPCSICSYEENDINNFLFKLESLGQLTEKDLLMRSCLIIINKLKILKDVIYDKIKNYKSETIKDIYNLDNKTNSLNDELDIHLINGIIKLEHESHTMGPLITRYLQEDKHILFAGYKVEQLLVKELKITYKTDGKNILDIFNNIFDKIIKIYNQLFKQFETIK